MQGRSRRYLPESRGLTLNKTAQLKIPLICDPSWAFKKHFHFSSSPRESAFSSSPLPCRLSSKGRGTGYCCWVTALGFCSKVQSFWIRAPRPQGHWPCMAVNLGNSNSPAGQTGCTIMATDLNGSHHLNPTVNKNVRWVSQMITEGSFIVTGVFLIDFHVLVFIVT